MLPTGNPALSPNPSAEEIYRQLALLTARLQSEPANADLLKLRGEIYYRLSDKGKAWQDLRRALELKPELLADINGEAKTPERKVFKINTKDLKTLKTLNSTEKTTE